MSEAARHFVDQEAEMRRLKLAETFRDEIAALNPEEDQLHVEMAAEEAATLLTPAHQRLELGMIPGYEFSSVLYGLKVQISRTNEREV